MEIVWISLDIGHLNSFKNSLKENLIIMFSYKY